MGALENTRGSVYSFISVFLPLSDILFRIGDMKYKPYGVTAEPEVRTKLLEAPEWAYIVLVTDGVTSVLSDAEIVDLARNARDPRTAAKNILEFAEEMGSDDNATTIVLPLAGWGKVTGPDRTKELREYRRTEMSESLRCASNFICISIDLLFLSSVGMERLKRM